MYDLITTQKLYFSNNKSVLFLAFIIYNTFTWIIKF